MQTARRKTVISWIQRCYVLGKDCCSAVIFPKNASAEVASYVFVIKKQDA